MKYASRTSSQVHVFSSLYFQNVVHSYRIKEFDYRRLRIRELITISERLEIESSRSPFIYSHFYANLNACTRSSHHF